jgi:translation initiation factor 2B subunit (eIF-2B alpha/beta/delta family)
VRIGASALLSNGTVFAPAGTGMIACLAKNRRVPVIFAAESYKFCEKVQLDSIVYNELGDYRELLKPDPDSSSQVIERGLSIILFNFLKMTNDTLFFVAIRDSFLRNRWVTRV